MTRNRVFKQSIATFSVVALFTGLAACSKAPAEPAGVTASEWNLNSEASELSYVTIKSGEIAEANTFETLTGSVSGEGAAAIEIDLASVSTGVDIRDERMREILFEVMEHPMARVSTQVEPATFEALAIGESAEITLDGQLTLKTVEAEFEADVTVTRAGEDRVLVVSDKPVILDAGALGLSDGLAQLQELAGLPSISPAVPVSFSITFER